MVSTKNHSDLPVAASAVEMHADATTAATNNDIAFFIFIVLSNPKSDVRLGRNGARPSLLVLLAIRN